MQAHGEEQDSGKQLSDQRKFVQACRALACSPWALSAPACSGRDANVRVNLCSAAQLLPHSTEELNPTFNNDVSIAGTSFDQEQWMLGVAVCWLLQQAVRQPPPAQTTLENYHAQHTLSSTWYGDHMGRSHGKEGHTDRQPKRGRGGRGVVADCGHHRCSNLYV